MQSTKMTSWGGHCSDQMTKMTRNVRAYRLSVGRHLDKRRGPVQRPECHDLKFFLEAESAARPNETDD